MRPAPDIREADGGLGIGGMTYQETVEGSPLVVARCPRLPEALAHVGHPAIRSSTAAGSLRERSSDGSYTHRLAPVRASSAMIWLNGVLRNSVPSTRMGVGCSAPVRYVHATRSWATFERLTWVSGE